MSSALVHGRRVRHGWNWQGDKSDDAGTECSSSFIDVDGHGVVHLGGFPEELAIEEVLVTAQKRSQSVLEAPIALTAHSGDGLVEIGALDVKDVITRKEKALRWNWSSAPTSMFNSGPLEHGRMLR